MLKHLLSISVSFLLVLALIDLFSQGVFIVHGADDASSIVAEADVTVRQAFKATIDAESAGANVSALVLRLNEAGRILGEAEAALKNGNSTEAVNGADQCIGVADSVKGDAVVLKASALAEGQSVFRTSLAFSVVSIAVFVVLLLLVWRRFKRRYVGKVLGMKPEVPSSEA
jgi:hypothetical protein